MTETTLRRIKTGLYGVGPGLGLLSFERNGTTDIVSCRYSASDGSFLGERGRYAFNMAWWTQPVGIQVDPLGNVGDGSWAWNNGTGTLYSWDVMGNSLSTYSVPAGYDAAGPIYLAGYLYWVERGFGTKPRTMRLMRATCDLGGVTTVGSLSANPAGTSSWTHPPMMALNSTAAISYTIYNGTIYGMRFTLDGLTATFAAGAHLGQGLFLPASDGGSVGAALMADLSTRGWLHLGDSIAASPTLQWPTTGDWNFGNGTADDWILAGWVSDDGTIGVGSGASGPVDPSQQPKAVIANSLASGGSPDAYFAPAIANFVPAGTGAYFALMQEG